MFVRSWRSRLGMAILALLICVVGQAGEYVVRSAPGYKNPSGGTISYTGTLFPYLNGSAGYGAEHYNDSNFVWCGGTITTVFDWVPDQIPDPANPGSTIADPLDLPPAEVVSRETCAVEVLATYALSGDADPFECDNGLGFEASYTIQPQYMMDEETQILIGYAETGSSSGTRFKKQAGGPTVTLTCTPYAVVSVVNGLCSASVWYSSSIIVPTVELKGETRLPNSQAPTSPHAIKFLTGQRINAILSLANGPGPMPQGTPALTVDPASYQWGFESNPGDPFKDYIYGAVGERKELLAADKNQSAFNFYTNEDGTTRVKCDFRFVVPAGARYEGGPLDNPLGFTAYSKVVSSVRPGYVFWGVNDGTVQLFTNSFQFAGVAGVSTNGQQWFDVDYNVPSGFGTVGHVGAFCQLINADRNLYRTAPSQGAYTHFIKNPHNAVPTLDVSMPYPSGTWDAYAQLGTGYDSPYQPLTDIAPLNLWYLSTASDTYESFAMYKPPSVDSQPTTWIPMGYYTWRWRGTATLGQSGWVLSGTTPSGKDLEPFERHVHPTWQLNKISPSPFGFIGVPY